MLDEFASEYVKFIKGDLFKHVSPTENAVIAHGCSAQGVMGKGFAKMFKQWFYQDFLLYRKFCISNNRSSSILGKLVIGKDHRKLPYVPITAITQHTFGNDKSVRYVDYDAYKKALDAIYKFCVKNKKTLHMPAMGTGLGNGDPVKLRAILIEAANDYKVQTTVYSL